MELDMTAVRKLSRDQRAAAVTLGKKEARFLVDAYYLMQENRIRAAAQVRAMSDEPHDVLIYLQEQNTLLEAQVKYALDQFSMADPVGVWMRSQKGVGPVIAAGLLAHLDITKAQTAGAFWSFAGLDPRVKWGKGQKRPWNASLKTLCWKIGESFVKVSGRDDAFYGQVYAQRKKLELERNEAGEFAEQARIKLETVKIGQDKAAYITYASGKLPDAHLHARAKRYAVKLFLAHVHEQMWRSEYGTEPPLPYAIAHMGHAHKIDPPN